MLYQLMIISLPMNIYCNFVARRRVILCFRLNSLYILYPSQKFQNKFCPYSIIHAITSNVYYMPKEDNRDIIQSVLTFKF